MRIGKKRDPIHKDYGLDTGLEGEGIPLRPQEKAARHCMEELSAKGRQRKKVK